MPETNRPHRDHARADNRRDTAAPVSRSTKAPVAGVAMVGRYQLCFELASGGMATVYLARADGAPGFEKLVALKRVHKHLAKQDEYVRMFLDEARIASRITHANVCSVFDFGEVNGEYFMAMEYLVGEPLLQMKKRIAQHPALQSSPQLPLIMARIIADAAEGLHAAHELKDADGQPLNVVHRDVSARNLFVTYDGAVQVVDFGIASARERLQHTSTGFVKGTFGYMAPEQMLSAGVDRRADLWALGVVLWELLAMKRLFKRNTDVNTMYAVLKDDVPQPSRYNPHVPAELDAIVLKLLQRNPADRYQSGREVAQALSRFLANERSLIGPGDISEWMATLFPGQEDEKRRLMALATRQSQTPRFPEESGKFPTQRAREDSFAPTVTFAPPGNQQPSRGRWSFVLMGLMSLVTAAAVTFAVQASRAPHAPAPAADNSTPAKRSTRREPVDAELLEPIIIEQTEEDETAPAEATVAKSTTSHKPSATDADEPRDESSTRPVRRRKANARRAKQRRAKASAANSKDGFVTLVAKGGWAHVYSGLGDKKIGTTPLVQYRLPAGRHRLRIEPNGDSSRARFVTVTVTARETRRVTVPMQ